MTLAPRSRLVNLPIELQLIILHYLCETHQIPPTEWGEGQKLAFYFHLRSLSLVCKHLRRLCLSPLFSRLKITHTRQLRLLETKCAAEPEFARLIRQLDLTHVHSPEEHASRRRELVKISGRVDIYRYGPHIFPAFIPGLKSLEWLGLEATQLDADLLSTLNSHTTLVTVAICDRELDVLRTSFSSTSMSLSKIRVHSALLDILPGLRSPALHSLTSRGIRLAHLILRNETNIRLGPGHLLIPGLETLDVGVYKQPTSLMSWLPLFVERHANLQTIKFSGYASIWTHNPDILFPLQFIDAVEREALTGTVDLVAFSLSRTRSAVSLDDWQVAHLQMEITKGAGVSAMRIASSMAPRISSLVVRMSRWGKQPFHTEDLISSLCLLQDLRTLELHCVHRHLLFEGEAPWALPPSSPGLLPTSRCNVAHAALRWLTARVAQRALALDFIRITDEGYDFINHQNYPWRFEAIYRVEQNREIGLYGTPVFRVGYRFRKPSPDPYAQPAPCVRTSARLLPPRAPSIQATSG
ncbi:hypothetical protein DFH08DRAFT_1076482 [Mycena albidolilacea]|uniref:F-box domain-containing protein n=1 Tax=Mycena albidolilacea TaxID=1033008 RepID=A0AAD7EW38_9AGAR|nr:hypothetical protein DFH08DRAFT_1076482 [Mycena albidolilacea]